MGIQQFCELVCDPEQMYKYPVFLAGFVVPNRIAFKQYDMWVHHLKTHTHDEWMVDKANTMNDWPSVIEQLYTIFIKEFYHE